MSEAVVADVVDAEVNKVICYIVNVRCSPLIEYIKVTCYDLLLLCVNA